MFGSRNQAKDHRRCDNSTFDCFDGATLSENKQYWNHDKFLEWDNFVIAQRTMPVIDVRMLYWRMDAHISNLPLVLPRCRRHESLSSLGSILLVGGKDPSWLGGEVGRPSRVNNLSGIHDQD